MTELLCTFGLEKKFLYHLEATNQGQQTDKIGGRHPAQSAQRRHRGSACETEGQAGFLDVIPTDVNDELDTTYAKQNQGRGSADEPALSRW